MLIASRMVAIGHLIGYAVGSVDMISIFGTTLGDSQFKQMTVIAAVSLIFCVAVTCYAVNERVLVSLRYVFGESLCLYQSEGLTVPVGMRTRRKGLSRFCRNCSEQPSTSHPGLRQSVGCSSGHGLVREGLRFGCGSITN